MFVQQIVYFYMIDKTNLDNFLQDF
jgi:hypothetical protein